MATTGIGAGAAVAGIIACAADAGESKARPTTMLLLASSSGGIRVGFTGAW